LMSWLSFLKISPNPLIVFWWPGSTSFHGWSSVSPRYSFSILWPRLRILNETCLV
jgi:hypothetical protein